MNILPDTPIRAGLWLAVLGGFGLAIVLITGVITTTGSRASEDPDLELARCIVRETPPDATGLSEDQRRARELAWNVPSGDPDEVDDAVRMADVMRAVRSHGFTDAEAKAVLDECLEDGEVLVQVTGLPGVSGIYGSRTGNAAVSGLAAWSAGGTFDDRLPNLGVCYVNPEGTPFRTTLVHVGNPSDIGTGEFGAESRTETITIDVGVTGLGSLFASVTREEVAASAPGPGDEHPVATVDHPAAEFPGQDLLAASHITHNYYQLPAQSRIGDPVKILSFSPLDDGKAFTGVVTFEVKTHNDRAYIPYTDVSSVGATVHVGTIRVWCRGGTSLGPPPTVPTTTTSPGIRGSGTVTVGDRSYQFDIERNDVCEPDRNGLFTVEAAGVDDRGRPVFLMIHAPIGAGFAIVEVGDPSEESVVWVADTNVYGNYQGQDVPAGIGAAAEIDDDTIRGSGQFYEEGAMDEAFFDRSPYDGPVEPGTFDVDCSRS